MFLRRTLLHAQVLIPLFVTSISLIHGVVIYGQTDQPQERMIKKLSWPEEPVKIKAVKNRDKTIELGKKFSAGDDWLKDLVVTVDNTSGKPILFIAIDLRFKRNDDSQEPPWSFMLAYGRRKLPNEPLHPDAPKALLPGEDVNISFYDGAYDEIKRRLQELNYHGGIRAVDLIVNDIYFADGTRWYAGKLFYPDPGDPNTWSSNTQPNDGALNYRSNQYRWKAVSSFVKFSPISFDTQNPPFFLD
jgi:hypothetical protein